MTNRDVHEKATRLAKYIRSLYALQRISRSCARNWLDRLALRMENEGHQRASDDISVIFMSCI